MNQSTRLAEILLVEDNEGDVELTREAFEDARFRNDLRIVRDGDEALDYLFKRNGYNDVITPDIILLDLNLPKTNGREVLAEIKGDPTLKHIPTIVLTSSQADRDVLDNHDLQANCYVVKPIDAIKFLDAIQKVENFWVDIVCRPLYPLEEDKR